MRAISAATGKIWISIHVLRVEDDPAAAGVVAHGIGFQSTSSVWRTTRQKTSCAPALTFQSTSSVWRTTACRPGRVCKAGHFNPRPPCGGRRLRSVRQIVTFLHFNPRPPCGGRQSALRQSLSRRPFQSTSSVWRTTEDKVCADSAEPFQSTSSVWRTTGRWAEAQIGRVDFNPRPPCGGRHFSTSCAKSSALFQSTSSVWRTTRRLQASGLKNVVFQSTSSVWRTTNIAKVEDIKGVFQSTSSVWRTTKWEPAENGGRSGFQSTSSVWRTTARQSGDRVQASGFQSTSSVWRTTRRSR